LYYSNYWEPSESTFTWPIISSPDHLHWLRLLYRENFATSDYRRCTAPKEILGGRRLAWSRGGYSCGTMTDGTGQSSARRELHISSHDTVNVSFVAETVV